jgi:NAD(P)-dependent dehydrogenase (short-subunit alcohol dehydrogenase family)
MRLLGRKVLVTGGSRGLGKALVQRFAREGAWVALCAREAKDLELVAQELKEVSNHVVALPCDIRNPENVGKFVKGVLDEFEWLDVLVNNASAAVPLKPLADHSAQEWGTVVDTNLTGAFYVTRAVVPSMIERKSGMILNVSSSVGRAPRAQWGAYSISKIGLEAMTQLLTSELRTHQISVNSVNPGALATEMRRVVHPEEDQTLLRKPEMSTDIFVYLASNDGAGISGQSFDASTYIPNV